MSIKRVRIIVYIVLCYILYIVFTFYCFVFIVTATSCYDLRNKRHTWENFFRRKKKRITSSLKSVVQYNLQLTESTVISLIFSASEILYFKPQKLITRRFLHKERIY